MNITTAQMRAAYDALGLDPYQWEHTREVILTPNGVVHRVMDEPRTTTPINTVAQSTFVHPVGDELADGMYHAMNILADERDELIEQSDREAFDHAVDVLQRYMDKRDADVQ